MNLKKRICKIMPSCYSDKGITLDELCEKIDGVSKDEVEMALDVLFHNSKIETMKTGDAPVEYRYAIGVTAERAL